MGGCVDLCLNIERVPLRYAENIHNPVSARLSENNYGVIRVCHCHTVTATVCDGDCDVVPQ